MIDLTSSIGESGRTATRAPRFTAVAPTAGVISIAIGLTVIVGWTFDVELLKTLFPGAIVMLPNTGLMFVINGATLTALTTGTDDARRRRFGRIGAWIVLVLGGLFFTERLTGMSFGIDALWFETSLRRYP